jgi:hypothetical protein
MVDPNYVEAIVTLTKEAMPQVQRWLTDRGLQSVPMQAGLLATGDRATFEAAFGVDLHDARLPVRLEAPPDLSGAVSSIVIPRLKSIT